MASRLFGGVEGGGTKTTLAIFDETGKPLVHIETKEGTNLALVGPTVIASRIKALVITAYSTHPSVLCRKLTCLGLGLSGAEDKQVIEALKIELKSQLCPKYLSNVSRAITIVSDSIASLRAVTDGEGILLISGTGSCCVLLPPDVSSHDAIIRCGGGGHLIGDEGSAIQIALSAIRLYFQLVEGREHLHFSVKDLDMVETLLSQHFELSPSWKKSDLYHTLYSTSIGDMKARVAGLTERIASAAEKGDRVCSFLFKQAGIELGDMICAVLQRRTFPGGTNSCVVCVGSVFQSWTLLMQGVWQSLTYRGLQSAISGIYHIHGSSAYGAARVAASKLVGAETGATQLPLLHKSHLKSLYEREQTNRAHRGRSVAIVAASFLAACLIVYC